MKRIIHRLELFIMQDYKTKWLMLEIFILLAVARVMILVIPFKRLSKHLGQHNRESPADVSKENYLVTHRIGCLVMCVSKYTPWQSKCLVQAMVAQYLLKKRNIGTTLYLGIAKKGAEDMTAHAWLRVGSMIVTGGAVAASFKMVSKFANDLCV